jgi:L-asparagine transporter-like permease
MSKNKNSYDNLSLNFVLRSFNSVQVGLYFLLAAFLIKSSLENFIADNNPMGMMSIEIIEILILFVVIFMILFSSFALLFSGRRQAKKYQYKLWNGTTKKYFLSYLILSVLGIVLLKMIVSSGNTEFLAPIFLVYYGIFLAIMNSKKKKILYLISGLSGILAFLVFIIPTYWYSALLILGTGHIIYGLVNRK